MLTPTPTAHSASSAPPRSRVRPLLSLALVLAMLFALPSGTQSGSANALATIFASIVLEALPFMLLGALVGGLIEAFVSRERMASLVPRSPLAAICVAAGMGIIFPVCECAIVPVVRRLLGKGLPFSAAIAYLLAGPIVNPIVAGSTLLAYGLDWEIAGQRIVLGYVIAVSVAFLMSRLFPQDSAVRPGLATQPAPACACGCASAHDLKPFSQIAGAAPTPAPAGLRLRQALHHGAADFLTVGHYLIIGAFLAALAQTYIDRTTMPDVDAMHLGSVLLMNGLAVALNLCSEADAFIAASFQGIVPMPAQMAFMLTGPMFDLKLLLMYQIILRKRAILILGALILTFTSGAGAFLLLGDG